jgi:hypothetical protein
MWSAFHRDAPHTEVSTVGKEEFWTGEEGAAAGATLTLPVGRFTEGAAAAEAAALARLHPHIVLTLLTFTEISVSV